jgi:beta-galactosidase/beta-glucuronidase
MSVFAHKPKAALLVSVIAMILFLVSAVECFATGPDHVKTMRDDQGWKLRVNEKDFFVKGVVWGYTPKGENYSYNLWSYSDDFIRDVLDYDMPPDEKAGVNTIRSFGIIPPRWVTYIYETHGIMTIVNHLMGRYGFTVDGAWIPQINYSDPRSRAALKEDVLKVVNQFKDVPGVLMFALGNESQLWPGMEQLRDRKPSRGRTPQGKGQIPL